MTGIENEDNWDLFLEVFDGMEYREIVSKDGFSRLLIESFDDPEKISMFLRRMNGPITRTTIAEQRRVEQLLARDREDAETDRTRNQALRELEDGGFVNLQDTVTGPTREQLANGEFIPFTPSIENYTKATVKGMRRLSNSTVLRMHKKGQITDEGFSACIWYARKYEQSGLEGSVGSIDYGKEVFSAPHDRIVFTERQQQAQSDIRAVNKELPKGFLKFFQKIVVENLPVHSAKRFCRIKAERALPKFKEMTQTSYEAVKDVDPEYGGKK